MMKMKIDHNSLIISIVLYLCIMVMFSFGVIHITSLYGESPTNKESLIVPGLGTLQAKTPPPEGPHHCIEWKRFIPKKYELTRNEEDLHSILHMIMILSHRRILNDEILPSEERDNVEDWLKIQPPELIKKEFLPTFWSLVYKKYVHTTVRRTYDKEMEIQRNPHLEKLYKFTTIPRPQSESAKLTKQFKQMEKYFLQKIELSR